MTQDTLAAPLVPTRRSYHRTSERAGSTGLPRSADTFWPVLRDLIEAKAVFGLRRPVLATLRALISFLDEGSTVFASNRTISTRAEGISESALRRHVKALVDMGLVERRDSSNRKRYRIDAEGQEDLIFGLDLAPLKAAHARIAEAAETCRRENRVIRHLRKRLGQLIFAARQFGQTEAELDNYQKALRQKLSSTELQMLCETLDPGENQPLIEAKTQTESLIETQSEPAITSKMTGTDIQNDCHKNITIERSLNLVQDESPSRRPKLATQELMSEQLETKDEPSPTDPALLRKARALAPDAFAYAEAEPKTWQEVETLAWRLASWSGISPRLLSDAIEEAGQRMTAMAVLLVTQNAGRIRNPGAYFRTLTMGRHFPRFSRPLAHLS